MIQDWFHEAKLGIFIHWGLYSVDGIPESWAFFNNETDYETYLKQMPKFTAENYDPKAWAELFKRSGARYAMLTTKHHDGMALWDTQVSDFSVVHQTPAGRDLIAPYAEAMREAGIKVGFYFSHLDWSHPDYSPTSPGVQRNNHDKDEHYQWIEEDGKENWERFLAFHRAQLKELCSNYGDVDIWWFDGDWRPKAEYWRMEEAVTLIRELQPKTIFNSRIASLGDYATPEQAQPIIPPDGAWEYSLTMNDSWGYQVGDDNHKSPLRLIRLFCETIASGGNMLLGIGPYADGTFQPEQVKRLEILGDWIHKHEEAIYPTRRGIDLHHYPAPTTLSKDGKTLYAMIFDTPRDGISIKGIHNQVQHVSVVGSGKVLEWSRDSGAEWIMPPIPSVLRITVPEDLLDPYVTIIKVELDSPIDLYTGSGSAIEDN